MTNFSSTEFTFLTSALIGVYVLALTPGPNNTIALALGLRSGVKGAIYWAIGVGFGMGLMFLVVGLTLASLVEQAPWIMWVVRIVGVSLLLWLAYKIGSASEDTGDAKGAQLPGKGQFWDMPAGIGFQWINPKAWTAAVGLSGSLVGTGFGTTTDSVIIALLFITSGLVSVTTWSLLGAKLKRFISGPAWRPTMIALAVLLLVSTLPVLLKGF